MSRCRWALAWVAALGCHSSPPAAAAPRTRADAIRGLVRCALDDQARDASAIESAVRRELRRDRHQFSLRAGRCARVLDAELRVREPALEALSAAWESLLVEAQRSRPDDIALERAVRHVGNAAREALR